MKTTEQLKRALYATRLRACDAHAAVWRAMQSSPAEALAACQDDGYLHLAVHSVFQIDTDIGNIDLDAELMRHIAAQDERINRLEGEIARLRSAGVNPGR